MNIEKLRELHESTANKGEMFAKMGIARQSFIDILTKKSSPRVENLEKIAKFFNKPVGYFFDEPDAEETNKELTQYKTENTLLREKIKDLNRVILAQEAHIETLTGKKATAAAS